MDLARIKGNVAKMAAVNAPEADIDGYIASEGATIDDVRNFGAAQQPKGFIDNVSEDLGGRIDKQKEIYNTPQNGLSGTLQTFGNIAGAGNDVIKQVINSTGRTLYDKLPQGAQDTLKQAGEDISQGRTGQLLRQYQSNQDTYNKQHPEAGRNFEAIREIGGFLMPGGTKNIGEGLIGGGKALLQTGSKVASKAGEGAVSVARDITGIEKRPQLPTPEQMGNVSTDLYKQSELEGGVTTPDFANQFIKEANTVAPLNEKAAAIRGNSPIQEVLDSINTFKDKPFTMSEIDSVDKELTRKLNSFLDGGLATPESRDIQLIQNKFRDLVDQTEVPGVSSWKDAKSAFATKKRLDDIQDIFDNAKNRPNEATAIQAGFRRIAEDEGRMRGYSPEARKYIKQAARNNNSVDTLKLMGSRLLPIVVGGSGGGVAATAATAAGGAVARSAGASIKAYQGNKAAFQLMRDFEKKASPKTKAALTAELLKK